MIRHMIAFAPSTPKLGEFNQLRGVLSGLMHFCCEDVHFAYNLDMCFDNVAGGPLKRHLYADDEAFERDVFRCLDDYFSRHLLVPKVFVTICSPEDAGHAAANVDAVCRAVKDYYAAHGMGRVVTAAVNSSIYRYRFADVVHVCGHLLSEEDRQTLEADAELKRKVFVSEGIIHNMSRTFIRQKFGQPKMREIAAAYRNGRPNAVFALGGRVEGPEIRFTLSHAENIFRRMRALADKNYNVIVVNGPRTPNEVTDYFYEQSLAAESKIAFFNSKQVARTDEERVPEKWRVYSGKHEEEFLRQAEKYGNVYPGVLGLENTLVVHTFDSFACCETAASGIPTAICREVEIDRAVRPDCYRLADQLTAAGYAADFADFDGEREPRDLKLKVLPSVNSLLAKKIIDRLSEA